MRVGQAWTDITPSGRLPIQGQMHIRWGEFTHDPLTVNAVVFDDGEQRIALVSCDLCMLPGEFVRAAQSRCERELGLPAASVLVACTHTHLGPYTHAYAASYKRDRMGAEVDPALMQLIEGAVADPAFMQSVEDAIANSISRAVDDLEEVALYAGSGYLEQMGFNRRGLHADGTADMYHGIWNADFAGLEGPRDGEVSVLFATKPNGRLKVVIPNFSTHPNSVESESFYSADLVGATRRFLRSVFGRSVGVVYLTGAAGNTAPTDLEKSREQSRQWRGERGLLRSGRYLGAEIVKVIEGALDPMEQPVLALAQAQLQIPIREYPAGFDYSKHWNHEVFRLAREDWPRMLAEESPVDVRMNVLRVGDAVICTNPAELYVEFGLQIKKGSPARVTLISELTDGYVGYVATREAISHGGYSAMPFFGCKLDEGAGDTMVQATKQLLTQVCLDS